MFILLEHFIIHHFPLIENVIKKQYSLSFLVNAADNKQRDKNMSCIKVTIDV